MYIGTSIFLIALGAILHYAVTATVVGIEIQTAGTILMVVGVIGLIISLAYMASWRRREGPRPVAGARPPVVEREREYH